jgi:hypothetical protein
MYPELIVDVAGEIKPADFPDLACRQLVETLLAAAPARPAEDDTSRPGPGEGRGQPQVMLAHELVRTLEQQGQLEAISLVGKLTVGDGVSKVQCERIVYDCIRFLQEHSLTNRIIEVRQEVQRLEQAGQAVPSHLLEEYTRLVRSVKARPTES